MSASSKKKLRKEQNSLLNAEKNKAQKKENRRLKITSTIFILLIVGLFITGITLLTIKGIKRSAIVERNTIALTLDGNYELNSIQMAYYYIDTIETQMNQNSMYLMMGGLDYTVPLDEQDYSEDQTWAEYFVELAATRARDEYALRKAAEKAGFELSEDDKALLESAIQEKTLAAMLNYGTDLDTFLSNYYCNGANEENYTEYLYTGLLAESYYTHIAEEMNFTDAERAEFTKDTYHEYSSFSYASYFISYSNYLSTMGEDVTVTNATEEQKAAALELAKADAELLKQCTTVEELDAAIAQLSFNLEKDPPAASVKNNNVLFTNMNSNVQTWVIEEGRKANDTMVYANESSTYDDDGNEKKDVSGYTVVIFLGRNDNEYKLSNVRHLLVAFEGGTYDANTGMTVYTDDEKKLAKDEAERLLANFKAGAATEEAFIELVKAETDDTASIETGGLYEDISPSSGYVTNFLNWAVDQNRQIGDVEIVETEYGYHIMYYSGKSDTTYRNSMIDSKMQSEALETWYTETTEAVKMEIGDTRHLNTSLILQPAE